MEEDSPCFSDVRVPIQRQDKNDLINNLVEEISSLSISQKSGAASKRNRGNALKVRPKDGGTALGNRKVINVHVGRDCGMKSAVKKTIRKRIDKNLVKQRGGTKS